VFKADLHMHSRYSMDCNTSLVQIIEACQEKSINCINLCDHGAIEGALELRKMAPFTVIVSEEILTTSGEIMGMFLNEVVPSGLSMEESIARIKDQGGLFCTPHPYDRFRPTALNAIEMDKFSGQIDVVEVFNARSPLIGSSNRAAQFAKKHHIPGSAGSDAHNSYEIGNAYVEMPEFSSRDEFLQALVRGQVFGHRSNPLTRFGNVWARFKKS
jgi:predicted metal-dependent phosphoesterase TrpH